MDFMNTDQIIEIFKETDTNGDGTLSRSEVMASLGSTAGNDVCPFKLPFILVH